MITEKFRLWLEKQKKVMDKNKALSGKSQTTGSAYLYDDIEDLFATCYSVDDITERDKYIWRMARLKMPNSCLDGNVPSSR